MDSTFECDGYRDGKAGNSPRPPDVPVYRAEYLRGYDKGRSAEAKPGKGSAVTGSGKRVDFFVDSTERGRI